jgi:predicted PurR-regulated permease PerM
MKNRMAFFFYLSMAVLLAWFFYLDRAILSPFIVAAIFAYVFNPVVSLAVRKFRIGRTTAVIILYVIILVTLTFIGLIFTRRLFVESLDLQRYVAHLSVTTKKELINLPLWAREIVNDTFASIQSSDYFSSRILFILFPQAVSKIVSFIIFLFAGFFFLKDGKRMTESALQLFPVSGRQDIELLLKKINMILSGYLRGQLFLVAWVSSMLFIILTVLGVRFALILAIFSGFAEIVPFIGPIVATAVVALVVLVTGNLNFGLSIQNGVIAVIIAYTSVRQIQDYLVTPYVMQRVTKLHPLLILFSVLSGEHLFGVLGVILGVPIVASSKILLEYVYSRIDKQRSRERNKPDSV